MACCLLDGGPEMKRRDRGSWQVPAFAMTLTVACAAKSPPPDAAPAAAALPPPAQAEAPAPAPASADAREASRSASLSRDLERVHFEFDSAELTHDARAVLARDADALRGGSVAAVVEGHCDDVGTTEYNLALGERRAEAARRYLVTLGVAPDSLRTVSYGEERPLDATPTGRPSNRRAEILPTR